MEFNKQTLKERARYALFDVRDREREQKLEKERELEKEFTRRIEVFKEKMETILGESDVLVFRSRKGPYAVVDGLSIRLDDNDGLQLFEVNGKAVIRSLYALYQLGEILESIS